MRAGEAALRTSRFVTFDGGFCATNEHQRPDRYRHLELDLGKRKRIARGAGLSYAAASFGGASLVQQMTAFDRLLSFDPEARTLRVEAGASIGAIVGWAARHRLTVAVVPGYPSITIGGCIAADVHGKNPMRDGTFADWVESMTVYHPAHGFRTVGRDDEVRFDATCGGYGLTGVVVDATLRLAPQPAPHVRVEHQPVHSLEHAIESIDQASAADFAYSWHDGASRGKEFGRGILFRGTWTDAAAPDDDGAFAPMTAETRARWPFPCWNGASIGMANVAFRRLNLRTSVRVKSAFDAAFPFARQTLYHRFFGRRGLAEVQALIPDGAMPAFVDALRRVIDREDPLVVMLSVKRFRGRSASLGMSGTGVLLAMDVARNDRTPAFLREVDAIVLATGSQPNVAKDSRLPSDVAARSLRGIGSFSDVLRRLDPDRLYESELSLRLGL